MPNLFPCLNQVIWGTPGCLPRRILPGSHSINYFLSNLSLVFLLFLSLILLDILSWSKPHFEYMFVFVFVFFPLHADSLQSCTTLCELVDYSSPGSSVHGILQARILGWAAISSSRASSQPRDAFHVCCGSCTEGWFFTPEPSFSL